MKRQVLKCNFCNFKTREYGKYSFPLVQKSEVEKDLEEHLENCSSYEAYIKEEEEVSIAKAILNEHFTEHQIELLGILFTKVLEGDRDFINQILDL